MQAWLAADTLRSVCDKGNFWLTNRAHKLRTLKKGYSRIRPTMLPKGLSTFKKEHCDGFDNNHERAEFLRCRPKMYSLDFDDNSHINRSKFSDKCDMKISLSADVIGLHNPN